MSARATDLDRYLDHSNVDHEHGCPMFFDGAAGRECVCASFGFALETRARAELAALRSRVEDAELMLRCATGEKRYMTLRQKNKWPLKGSLIAWRLSVQLENDDDGCSTEFKLPDDGTGLPVLSDEARTALRRELGAGRMPACNADGAEEKPNEGRGG